MALKKILVIGRSHAMCMDRAAKAGLVASDCVVDTLFTNTFEPCFTGTQHVPAPQLDAALREKAAACDAVILMIQGNQHSILSLVEMDPPLRFVASDRTAPLAVPKETALVPEGMIREWYVNNLAELAGFLTFFRDLAVPVFVFGPPAPIEKEVDITARMDAYFTQRFGANLVVTDAGFRHDAWRLQMDVYAAFVDRHGGGGGGRIVHGPAP